VANSCDLREKKSRVGDEDLAKEALRRRRTYQDNADTMKKQLEMQKDAVQKMIANTRELEYKIQEAKSKKDTLKARAQSAKASKQVTYHRLRGTTKSTCRDRYPI